jgi:hypothetical protein
MTKPIDTNKYQVWFQDIDPDTGEICQTKLICIADKQNNGQLGSVNINTN